MNAKTIVASLGGPKRVAEVVLEKAVSRQAVSQWKVIPPRWCRVLAAASGGKLTVHDLRPDLFGEDPGAGPATTQQDRAA